MNYTTTTAVCLVSLALSQSIWAMPVPTYDSSTLLEAANTVFVGRVIKMELGSGEGELHITIRAEQIFKSTNDIQLGQYITMSTDGPRVIVPSTGTKGIFILDCKERLNCRPLNTFLPFLPAVETAAVPSDNQDADSVSTAVLAELVAVIGASNTALAAGTGEGKLTSDQAVELRSFARDAILTLPRAAALKSLHMLGRPSDLQTRLSISAAELTLADTSGLGDISNAMIDADPDLTAARRQVAWQGMGLKEVPSDLATVFADWLKSSDPQVRISAAYCLRLIHSKDVIEPLLTSGLNDSDPWVRYYSVGGLAAATGESKVPAFDLFFAQEAHYTNYWNSRKNNLILSLKDKHTKVDGAIK